MVYGLTGYGRHQYGTRAPYGSVSATALTASSTSTAGAGNLIDLRILSTGVTAAATSTAQKGELVGIKASIVGKTGLSTSSAKAADLLLFGIPGEVAVYIDGRRYKTFTDIEIKKRLNEVDTFSFKAFIEDNEDRQFIQEGKEVLFFEDTDLLFKGVLNEVEYKSSFRAECEGNGMVQTLLDRKTDRETYTNSAGDDIVKNVVPSSVMNYGTIETAPNVSVRFDHDNLARAVAGVANATGYDWFIDQERSDEFSEEYLNFVADAGSSTTQQTFAIGEDAQLVERNKDEGFVANNITLLGRGDGINQLEAQVFAAATAYTDTSQIITETESSSFTVDDAEQLGDVGDNLLVRVGTEVMDVDISDSTTLSINSRGLNDYNGDSTEQIKHYENIRVWRLENKTQGIGRFTPESKDTAEDGSSVEVHGVKEQRDTDKTIVDISTLEKTADLELKDRFEDVFRVQVSPTEPRVTQDLSLGDQVVVQDLTAMSVDDTFDITGMDVRRASSEEGTTLHLANRPRRLTERLSDIESNTDTLNAHMQGATNIDTQNFGDNADNTHPVSTKVFVPDDVVAVNKFNLVFTRESYRGYVQNSDHNHSFSITIPDHQHDIDDIPDHTHDLGTVEGIMTILDRVSTKADFSTSQIYTGDTLNNHTHVWPQDGVIGNLQMDVQIGYGSNETTNTQNTPSTTVTSLEGGGTTESDTSDSSGAPVYGIFEPGTEPDIDVEVYVDGTLVETVSNVSVGEEISTPIVLKNDLSEPIPDSYHEVELVPIDTGGGNNGRCRLNATVYQKVFIESTL